MQLLVINPVEFGFWVLEWMQRILEQAKVSAEGGRFCVLVQCLPEILWALDDQNRPDGGKEEKCGRVDLVQRSNRLE